MNNVRQPSPLGRCSFLLGASISSVVHSRAVQLTLSLMSVSVFRSRSPWVWAQKPLTLAVSASGNAPAQMSAHERELYALATVDEKADFTPATDWQ